MTSVMRVFNTTYKYMIIPLVILLIKDLCIATLSFNVAKKTGIVTGAKWYGKLCTIFLFLMSISHIIWFNMPLLISYAIVAIALLTMIISWILYCLMNNKLLKNN